jgi:acyl carrier protein
MSQDTTLLDTIRRHPTVQEAVALADLIAVVPRGRFSLAEIWSLAARQDTGPLPALALVDSLPRRHDGAVDEEQLRRDIDEQGGILSYCAPEGELEHALVDALQAIFAMQPIGVLDDFYAMGLDSAAAVELSLVIEELAPGTVTLEDIFQSSSVRRLASHVGEMLRQGPAP